MDRRAFLKTTGATAGAVATGAALTDAGHADAAAARSRSGPRARTPQTTWRLAVAPSVTRIPGADIFQSELMRRIEAATAGRIEVELVPGGTLPGLLGGPEQGEPVDIAVEFDLRPAGMPDAVGTALAAFTGELNQLEHDSFVPWLRTGGGQFLWDDALASYGIKPFHAALLPVTGGRILWSSHASGDTATRDDAVYAATGLTAAALRQYGHKVVACNSIAAAQALKSGRANAVIGSAPLCDFAYGLHLDAGHAFHYGDRSPIAVNVAVDQGVWDGLSETEQLALDSAISSAGLLLAANWHVNSIQAEAAIAQTRPQRGQAWPGLHGRIIVGMREVLARAAGADPVAERIIASHEAFRRLTGAVEPVATHKIGQANV